MKTLAQVLTLIAVIGLSATADAKGAGKKAAKAGAKNHPVHGLVIKTDKDTLTFHTGNKKKGQDITVTTNDKTTIKINGVDAKLDQLKANEKIKVLEQGGTASEITALDGKGHQKGGKGAKNAHVKKGKGAVAPPAPNPPAN